MVLTARWGPLVTKNDGLGHSGACRHAVTSSRGTPQRRRMEAEVCETRDREETDAPLTTHHTLRNTHTRAVLILIPQASGLVAFQGVNVPEVESEAARAKRCQRKKGDIGQRGARNDVQAEKRASARAKKERSKIQTERKETHPLWPIFHNHREVTRIQHSGRKVGIQSGIFERLVRAS
jgi:hypothetical protein